MFKQGMLRPNLLGLISADASNLSPDAFYPPLNEMGIKYLADLKKEREDFKSKYGKPLSFDIPDEDSVKYELFTDAKLEPPYYKAEDKNLTASQS